MYTMDEMYAVFHRHPRILSHASRSFVWLYETYLQVSESFGENSPHANAWHRLALESASNTLVQDFARRLMRCEAVGAYLNDDQAYDCSRCKLGDCRWRGRADRGPHCPKNTYGEWIHRPPRVI